MNANKIIENIKKCNSLKSEVSFYPQENGINEFIETIKKFWNVSLKQQFNSKIYIDEELIRLWLNERILNQNYYLEKLWMAQVSKNFIINVIIKEQQ